MTRLLRSGGKGLLLTCASILFLEAILRIAAFGWYRSEYYLFYGLHDWTGRVGINPWSTLDGAYYKFPPNYVLKGANGQASETASINSQGFRGPDFEKVKPKGVFRVVCLGESSTFGYHNHDDETYPFLLGRLFAQEKLPVEVINAGFPYYNSSSILSLLEQDIVNYDPDLITLYAGFNDTGWPVRIGPLGRLALWVQGHSIAYVLLRENMSSLAFRAERKVLGKLMTLKVSPERLREDEELVARRYRDNLRAMVRIAKTRRIRLILIKQPITGHEGNYASQTFEEETHAVRDKVEKGEGLSYVETFILKQHRLMEEVDKIGELETLPIVDNIKLVDQDRQGLASWVHLTAAANLRLAEALEPVIRPYVIRARSATVQDPLRPADSVHESSGSSGSR
jgi:lysophospholipase L1-like esterase